MERIKMLDCTLRDGGCVNDFNFGGMYMEQILSGIESSGIEIVELGYIDEKAGSDFGRTKFSSDLVIKQNFLKKKQPGVTYVAMTDYGRYDPDLLSDCTEETIDGIRLAFHKKNRKDIISWGRKIIQKGYKLFIQPMTCLRYSDTEMLDLISDVNTFLPEAYAFYIVDSFGEMRLDDLNRIAHLVDHNLLPSIRMGLHSHNNFQLSYSNAVTLLNFPTKRELIFDASILGMGKGAGNMTTELFAEHLNVYCEKNYRISPLLEVIDTVLNQIRQTYTWGYSVEYYLSAANHCTPSYASHFYRKHMLSVEQLAELLSQIEEEKKVSFDKEYADKLYYAYNERNMRDDKALAELAEKIGDKTVLLIAPGSSIVKYINEIETISRNDNVFSIALNNVPPIDVEYVFANKRSTYEDALAAQKNVIVVSNVDSSPDNGIAINYNSWTTWDGGKTDNAMVVMINVLLAIKTTEILLAGFDGFRTNVDENYYCEKNKRPVDKEQAERRNKRAIEFLKSIKNSVSIHFITPSIYQNGLERGGLTE